MHHEALAEDHQHECGNGSQDGRRRHLLLLEDVKLGLADIAAGRTEDADAAIARLQERRKPSAKISKTAKRRG